MDSTEYLAFTQIKLNELFNTSWNRLLQFVRFWLVFFFIPKRYLPSSTYTYSRILLIGYRRSDWQDTGWRRPATPPLETLKKSRHLLMIFCCATQEHPKSYF